VGNSRNSPQPLSEGPRDCYSARAMFKLSYGQDGEGWTACTSPADRRLRAVGSALSLSHAHTTRGSTGVSRYCIVSDTHALSLFLSLSYSLFSFSVSLSLFLFLSLYRSVYLSSSLSFSLTLWLCGGKSPCCGEFTRFGCTY